MSSVFRMSTPFQIGHIIVVLVTVHVVYTGQIARIGNECFSNQPVCHSVPVVSVFPQTHKFISVWIIPTIQDLGGKVLSIHRDPFAGSHVTVG